MKPTEEQIKELWRWCGFGMDGVGIWHCPGGIREYGAMPKPTLDNLFKWAVPKLQEINNEILVRFMFGSVNRAGVYQWTKRYSRKKNFEWLELGAASDKDPALALFWAIWKVIHERTND